MVFDYMIADIEANKILYTMVSELIMAGRKFNILLASTSQSYFKAPKDILSMTHYFIMKIPKKENSNKSFV